MTHYYPTQYPYFPVSQSFTSPQYLYSSNLYQSVQPIQQNQNLQLNDKPSEVKKQFTSANLRTSISPNYGFTDQNGIRHSVVISPTGFPQVGQYYTPLNSVRKVQTITSVLNKSEGGVKQNLASKFDSNPNSQVPSIGIKDSEIGIEMKTFEEQTKQKINLDKPIIIRLGGADFINFTKGLSQPFEEWLHDAFVHTTAFLVNEFGATIGYTQSDEISLLFSQQCDTVASFSSNRPIIQEPIQQIVSLLSSAATSFFSSQVKEFIENGQINLDIYQEQVVEKIQKCIIYFDARIFNLPVASSIHTYYYWRSQVDCFNGALNLTSQTFFTHQQTSKLDWKQKISLLKSQQNVEFEQLSGHFLYGTFVKKSISHKQKENETSQQYIAFSSNLSETHFQQLFSESEQNDHIYEQYQFNI